MFRLSEEPCKNNLTIRSGHFRAAPYDGTFEGLLTILAGAIGPFRPPERVIGRKGHSLLPPSVAIEGGRGPSLPTACPRGLKGPMAPEQPDLFGPGGLPGDAFPLASREDAAALAEAFFELSAGAYDSFLCGWMSEFPIAAECVRFGGKVFSAARSAAEAAGGGMGSPEARRGAERAAADRGDADVRTVLDAAYKVRLETDRLFGFLRFRPDCRGIYTARCAPDHFVLPRLAGHFSRRFGETPWLIVDEKRGLCLLGDGKGEPRLLDPAAPPAGPPVGFRPPEQGAPQGVLCPRSRAGAGRAAPAFAHQWGLCPRTTEEPCPAAPGKIWGRDVGGPITPR